MSALVMPAANRRIEPACDKREYALGDHDAQAASSPRIRILASAAAEIAGTRPAKDDVAYMHAILCQIGLPRSKVDGERFERASGSASLVIRAGELWDGRRMIPQVVPYGPTPRLVLAYMTRYAVLNSTREIPFGDSVNGALRLFDIAKGGQSYAMFRTQVSALAACSITLGFNVGDRALTFDGKPVQRFEAWLSDVAGQSSFWPSCIVLGQNFYDTLRECKVPHDIRALQALRGSALAMDVYLWLASRLWRVRRGGTPVYWHQLKEQFGQEYGSTVNFKKKFLVALRAAKEMYRDARIEPMPGGLRLWPSPPPVPPTKTLHLCKTL